MPSHDRAGCRLCVHAAATGWWGDSRVTHCRDCGNTWRRTSRTVECVSCHRLFGGHTTADRHSAKGNRCLDPATAGLVPSTNEYGSTVWRTDGAALPASWARHA